MPQILINDDELISVIEKKVNPNGQIYLGREYRDQVVRAYIVKVQGSNPTSRTLEVAPTKSTSPHSIFSLS